jgi:hypothetical protein
MTGQASIYVPTLPAGAFRPLPLQADPLPAGVREHSSPYLPTQMFDTPAQTEAVSRLLAALAAHGEWAAVSIPQLVQAIEAEWHRLRESLTPRDVMSPTVLALADGWLLLVNALTQLRDEGYLNQFVTGGDAYLYPTPRLIARIEQFLRGWARS